jgi:uncharacterized protein YbjT (DUF2867 family)
VDLLAAMTPPATGRFTMSANRVLVVGGTGKTGRRVAERLAARGVPVRIGSRSGEVALPSSDVGEPFVDADDIADVAVAALTDSRHVGQLYEVTGPRLLTFGGAVAEIAGATGRSIRYRPIAIDAFAAGAREAGVPEDVVSLLTYLFTEVLDGRNASLSDGVERALGRAPRAFADYARDTAATGVWTPRE